MGKRKEQTIVELVSDENMVLPLAENGKESEQTEENKELGLFTSVGIRRDLMSVVDGIAKATGKQKRDVLSILLMGFILSDDTIQQALFNFGNLGYSVLANVDDAEKARQAGFPVYHPLHGASLALTIDKLCAAKPA